jgi:hypothetical protein
VARLLVSIFVALLCVPALAAHAVGPKAKTNLRFKKQCDNGEGLACYSYGRAMWNVGNKKEGLKALARGCELKYKLSCDSYHDHLTRTTHSHKQKKYADGTGDVCFSSGQLSNARFTPNPVAKTGVQGQKIDKIKSFSFWDKAQLKENDVIVRVNNMPFNNTLEGLKAFSASGKTFGFEVLRDGETITLWYTCQ